MNKELLEKYCNNTCNEEELNSFLDWFRKSFRTDEVKELKDLIEKIWEEVDDKESAHDIDFDLILDKIHHKVNLAQVKELLDKDGRSILPLKKRENFLKILTRTAAILLLPVLGFGLYMTLKYNAYSHNQISVNQSSNEVFSSVDAITKVTLPDGSNVWLNHSSSLKYPAAFSSNVRMVELNGEGYFEVVHNSKIPFIVKTRELQIKAVGTTFNIMAYPDEYRIETSLIKGRIELQREEPDGKIIPLLDMKPTDMAVFQNGDNKIVTRTIEDDRNFSWKEGKLVFYDEPMGEVVKKLNRWFNADIQIKDPELLDLTYTATFIHETLQQVMELMTLMSPVHYSISERQEISPGTFAKRKIILSYKNK
jgi:transmembrane sensor